MVLLAGDLFHENKPTRQTMHKTMSILRRHCMGPDPVAVQIVSDQAQNFRSAVHGLVNYEDPYSSVDMPIFAIHGNRELTLLVDTRHSSTPLILSFSPFFMK